MLDPQTPVGGVAGVRDVTGGEDPWRAGLEAVVHHDPVLHLEPRALGDLGARDHADARDHEVTLDHAAISGAHAAHVAVALEGLDPRFGHEVDAPLEVEVAVDRSNVGPEDALERDRALLDDRHLEAPLACRGADLGADPARSHDEYLAAAVNPLADGVGVGEVAQRAGAVAGERRPVHERQGARRKLGETLDSRR